jgi:RHS repeat-associated protein
MLTGSLGQNVGGFSLYPFGGSLAATNTSAECMRFTGHERDLGVSFPAHTDDLDYMHARFYGPMTGRFLSVDPIGANPWLAQSWNRYAYVLGNPVNYIDPYGLDEQGPGDVYQADPQGSFGETIKVVGKHYRPPFWTPFPPSFPVHRPGGSGGGGRGGQHRGNSSGGLILLDPRALLEAALEYLCPPYAQGYSFDASTINPFSSSGGTSFGVNMQYVPGEGYGLYTFSTPSDVHSVGFDVGVSLTINRAIGSGPWSGDFYTAMGAIGPITFGAFGSPSDSLPATEPVIGWHGMQVGGTLGLPGAGVTTTSYRQRINIPLCQ